VWLCSSQEEVEEVVGARPGGRQQIVGGEAVEGEEGAGEGSGGGGERKETLGAFYRRCVAHNLEIYKKQRVSVCFGLVRLRCVGRTHRLCASTLLNID
jgi:hypothetical protein